MDDKFDLLRHPKVSGTADGKADSFTHGAVTESVGGLVFDLDLELKDLPELASVPLGSYELLSEEDLIERFNLKEEKSQ